MNLWDMVYKEVLFRGIRDQTRYEGPANDQASARGVDLWFFVLWLEENVL